MPTISMFYGIIIRMYNSAKDVPHFCKWGAGTNNRRRAYLPPR